MADPTGNADYVASDDAATVARPVVTQPYYADDLVTLYHGDCRELLPIRADVVVTDPPYGVAYRNWNGEAVANDHDFVAARESADLWPVGATWVVFANARSLRPTLTLVEPYKHVRVGVWHKSNVDTGGTFGNPWLADVEFFAIGTNDLPRTPASAVARAPRYVGNPAWQMSSDGFVHPTQKPLGLMRYVLSITPGGVVLDPFAGSGSTLRAAKDLGRRAIGIEIEERYCEIAARRLAQGCLDFGEAS